ALAMWREPDEVPSRAEGRLELARPELETRLCDALERAQFDVFERPTLVLDPGRTLPGQELASDDVERYPPRPPRLGPGTTPDRALRPMNGLGGRLDVDSGVREH